MTGLAVHPMLILYAVVGHWSVAAVWFAVYGGIPGPTHPSAGPHPRASHFAFRAGRVSRPARILRRLARLRRGRRQPSLVGCSVNSEYSTFAPPFHILAK